MQQSKTGKVKKIYHYYYIFYSANKWINITIIEIFFYVNFVSLQDCQAWSHQSLQRIHLSITNRAQTGRWCSVAHQSKKQKIINKHKVCLSYVNAMLTIPT